MEYDRIYLLILYLYKYFFTYVFIKLRIINISSLTLLIHHLYECKHIAIFFLHFFLSAYFSYIILTIIFTKYTIFIESNNHNNIFLN